jgi:predicted dehydrogenase
MVAEPVADAERLAAAMGVPRTSAHYRAALEDPAIDAVHVCTPNFLHFPIAKAALEAGKHVVCEKPLATSSAEGQLLVDLAAKHGLRNCTNHNLRYYPMVQHMRCMREDGELGEILVAQGTYSQDWLLYETDWNWRIESKVNGPSRVMADIGSHWCDMLEHVTGLRLSAVCADLQIFHPKRKRPKVAVESFAGKFLTPDDYDSVDIDTEDFGAVVFRIGTRSRGAFTASQVSAGRKNRLSMEIYGTKASVSWDQERPDELWIGNRNSNNQNIVKDPSLLKPAAQPYADYPGGHSEGYDDTFKQVFRRFYRSIDNPAAPPEYPQFADGLRQLQILEAELESNRRHGWFEVPS